MSKNFDMIKKWYDRGIWKEPQVRKAVEKGQITEEEYTLITGNEY